MKLTLSHKCKIAAVDPESIYLKAAADGGTKPAARVALSERGE